MITLESLNGFLGDVNCFNDLEPLVFLQKLRDNRDFVFKYLTDAIHSKKEMSSSIEMAVGVTMYLLNRILRSEGVSNVTKGLKINISSEISIGAGLGSSASYGVCISSGCYVIAQ